jgi:hypothetical protein
MNERFKKLIKPMIFAAAAIFVIFWIVIKPTEIGDYSSCIGYAISGVTILFVLYERILWRYIPWNRPPLLKKQYTGIISYVYKNQPGTKPIEISVKQSWLSVSIKTKTDINSSRSITGTIVSEYGDDVLYYNYITNPDAVTQGKNPIQYGTCRMVLDGDNSHIKGKYWTSSKTVGDMEWKEVSK